MSMVVCSPHGLLPGSPVSQSADDQGPLQREGRQRPDSRHPGHYRGQAVNLTNICILSVKVKLKTKQIKTIQLEFFDT